MTVLLIGAVNGCGGSPTQPWDGQVRVTGTISDFQTHASIAGARVTIGNATATADSSGSYSLTATSGEQPVSIDGESLGTVSMKDPNYRGDLLAHITGCIGRYGTVIDSQTRRPVVAATLSINGSFPTTTDTSGWFRMDVGCPGTMCVGFNTTMMSVALASYAAGLFPVGLGVCRVQRVDYELTPR